MKFSKDHQPENRRKPNPLTGTLKELLKEPYNKEKNKGEAILHTLINEAISGNIRAIQLIFERLEGKPLQAVTIEQTDFKLPDVIILPPNNSKPAVYREEDIIDHLDTR